MLRIGICDDIPFHADMLADHIRCWQQERQLAVQIIKFRSGEDLLFEIECTGDLSAVFLDIRLNGISGIETAIKVKSQNRLISVVFISSYENYYQEMHGLDWPILFLEKPFQKEKVDQCLNQFLKEYLDINKCFHFQSNHRTYTIDLHKVLYFSSEGRIVRAVLEDGIEYKMYYKLDDIDQVLQYYQDFFTRIHKSYLVNTTKIMRFHRKEVTLFNEISLPVSRCRKNAIIQLQMNVLNNL